jgi:hypothetical protein
MEEPMQSGAAEHEMKQKRGAQQEMKSQPGTSRKAASEKGMSQNHEPGSMRNRNASEQPATKPGEAERNGGARR